jgi:maltodextrin utilization protein YvdJ
MYLEKTRLYLKEMTTQRSYGKMTQINSSTRGEKISQELKKVWEVKRVLMQTKYRTALEIFLVSTSLLIQTAQYFLYLFDWSFTDPLPNPNQPNNFPNQD